MTYHVTWYLWSYFVPRIGDLVVVHVRLVKARWTYAMRSRVIAWMQINGEVRVTDQEFSKIQTGRATCMYLTIWKMLEASVLYLV